MIKAAGLSCCIQCDRGHDGCCVVIVCCDCVGVLVESEACFCCQERPLEGEESRDWLHKLRDADALSFERSTEYLRSKGIVVGAQIEVIESFDPYSNDVIDVGTTGKILLMRVDERREADWQGLALEALIKFDGYNHPRNEGWDTDTDAQWVEGRYFPYLASDRADKRWFYCLKKDTTTTVAAKGTASIAMQVRTVATKAVL